MSYGRFAYLYDKLMKDAPYDKWVEIVLAKLKKYNVEGKELLDLACGTGELSVRLSKAGFRVTGVDLSSDMLTVARAKADENGQSIRFFQQSMAELDGLGQFDAVCIFCDSLNYLETEEDVRKAFKNVAQHLKKDGVLLFDVHSIYKIMQVFMNETFAVVQEDISYIWQCYKGNYPNSIEHDLVFFVLDEETGQYDRFEELHVQRTFSVNYYENWLKEAGFEMLEIFSDFHDCRHDDKAERIFFIARKNE
ncbi:MCP methyltransferase, CheR-type [Bacillus methanolicus PB1]|uniref:MCP methyltransferase, CheR-type n=1 Tax=Bacillus methanolicus PB1 TaxID=997296 RepID=I3DXH8_BACMT|nr:class I SAM-dependent methyltransferase [Bacillus methanolicus]EIJ78949.1 MCP methyltransferase, CheR-type [Bacillus methanolicus PB1]